MDQNDRMLKCIECGQDFVFTVGEQVFFAAKGFQHSPRRCKRCKAKRSANRGEVSSYYIETSAVCSQCGKKTTVPFKPRMGRPVYCRECFQQRRSSAPVAQPSTSV